MGCKQWQLKLGFLTWSKISCLVLGHMIVCNIPVWMIVGLGCNLLAQQTHKWLSGCKGYLALSDYSHCLLLLEVAGWSTMNEIMIELCFQFARGLSRCCQGSFVLDQLQVRKMHHHHFSQSLRAAEDYCKVRAITPLPLLQSKLCWLSCQRYITVFVADNSSCTALMLHLNTAHLFKQ